MSDLLSVVLTLRPLPTATATPAPRWWGRAAQQALLALFRQRDAGLAAALHDDPGPRPYTVSNLLGRFPEGHLDAAQHYTLRFTTLRADLSAHLRALLADGPLAPGQTLELDHRPFRIQAVAAQDGAHPWAGQADFRRLSVRLVDTAPPRRFTFHLASPVSFQQQTITQPFPLPNLFFGSLLRRWNAVAPLALPPEAQRYAAERVVVSRFTLRSRAVPVKQGGLRMGATGQVTFVALNHDRYWLGILHTLAAFAFYAGVGAGTTHGLGQCRLLDTPS